MDDQKTTQYFAVLEDTQMVEEYGIAIVELEDYSRIDGQDSGSTWVPVYWDDGILSKSKTVRECILNLIELIPDNEKKGKVIIIISDSPLHEEEMKNGNLKKHAKEKGVNLEINFKDEEGNPASVFYHLRENET